MIQNALEREKMEEIIYKNKFFIPKINLRKIDVIPFTKIVCMPKQFFEARIKQLRNREIMEFLIKWKTFLPEDATWEDEYFTHKHSDLLKH